MAKIKAKGPPPPPLIIRGDESPKNCGLQPGQKIILRLSDGTKLEIKIEGKEIYGIMGVVA